MRLVIGVVIVAWLVVGLVGAGQRGFFGPDVASTCHNDASTALIVVAGPLNYAGVDPHVSC